MERYNGSNFLVNIEIGDDIATCKYLSDEVISVNIKKPKKWYLRPTITLGFNSEIKSENLNPGLRVGNIPIVDILYKLVGKKGVISINYLDNTSTIILHREFEVKYIGGHFKSLNYLNRHNVDMREIIFQDKIITGKFKIIKSYATTK